MRGGTVPTRQGQQKAVNELGEAVLALAEILQGSCGNVFAETILAFGNTVEQKGAGVFYKAFVDLISQRDMRVSARLLGPIIPMLQILGQASETGLNEAILGFAKNLQQMEGRTLGAETGTDALGNSRRFGEGVNQAILALAKVLRQKDGIPLISVMVEVGRQGSVTGVGDATAGMREGTVPTQQVQQKVANRVDEVIEHNPTGIPDEETEHAGSVERPPPEDPKEKRARESPARRHGMVSMKRSNVGPKMLIMDCRVYTLNNVYRHIDGTLTKKFICFNRSASHKCGGKVTVLMPGNVKKVKPPCEDKGAGCTVQAWKELTRHVKMVTSFEEIVLKGLRNPAGALNSFFSNLSETGQCSMEIVNRADQFLQVFQKPGVSVPVTAFDALDFFGSVGSWMRGGMASGGKVNYGWFMHKSTAEHLKKCGTWLIDGTFWTCPKGFRQLWNISAFDGKSFVPCAHFLLPDAKALTYTWAILDLLDALCPEKDLALGVRRIITDFEKAERDGIHAAFETFFNDKMRPQIRDLILNPRAGVRLKFVACNRPCVRFSGCLFHFCQAVVRWHAQHCPKTNPEYCMSCQLLSFFLWLPYFDSDFIIKAFAKMVCRMRECLSFIVYFYNTWMTCIDWWRIHDEDEEGILTNCGVEVFHRELKAMFNHAHPDWKQLCRTLRLFDTAHLKKNGHGEQKYQALKKVSRRRRAILDGKDTVREQIMKWVYGIGSNSQSTERIGVEWICELLTKEKYGPVEDERAICKRFREFIPGINEASLVGVNGEDRGDGHHGEVVTNPVGETEEEFITYDEGLEWVVQRGEHPVTGRTEENSVLSPEEIQKKIVEARMRRPVIGG
jgi:hypothetical protein